MGIAGLGLGEFRGVVAPCLRWGFFLSVAQYRRNLEQARLKLQRFTGFRDLRQFSLPAQVSFSGIMGANRKKVLRFQLCG